MVQEFPPSPEDVVIFSSRPAEEDGREFTLDADPAGDVDFSADDLAHEDDLVEEMTDRGFQLTMVGGGSRAEDVRRFYFRKGSA